MKWQSAPASTLAGKCFRVRRLKKSSWRNLCPPNKSRFQIPTARSFPGKGQRHGAWTNTSSGWRKMTRGQWIIAWMTTSSRRRAAMTETVRWSPSGCRQSSRKEVSTGSTSSVSLRLTTTSWRVTRARREWREYSKTQRWRLTLYSHRHSMQKQIFFADGSGSPSPEAAESG